MAPIVWEAASFFEPLEQTVRQAIAIFPLGMSWLNISPQRCGEWGKDLTRKKWGPQYLPQFVPFLFGPVTGTLHQLFLADPCDTAATIHNSGSGVVLFFSSRRLGNGSVIPLTTQSM
jgi:hypothetical protein